MQANEDEISKRAIVCAFAVSNVLGAGVLEGIYPNALAMELKHREVAFESQEPLTVGYRNIVVGEYVADFVINSRLIIAIKALSSLHRQHEAQVMNYLEASGIRAGLLLSFGTPRLGVRRRVAGHDDGAPI